MPNLNLLSGNGLSGVSLAAGAAPGDGLDAADERLDERAAVGDAVVGRLRRRKTELHLLLVGVAEVGERRQRVRRRHDRRLDVFRLDDVRVVRRCGRRRRRRRSGRRRFVTRHQHRELQLRDGLELEHEDLHHPHQQVSSVDALLLKK